MNRYRDQAKRLLMLRSVTLAMGGDESDWLAAIMLDVEVETRDQIAEFVRGYRDEEGLLEIAKEIRKGAYRG